MRAGVLPCSGSVYRLFVPAVKPAPAFSALCLKVILIIRRFCKKAPRHGGEGEKKDWKDWEYYDDWWEEDGKAAFHAYAEQKKERPADGGQAGAE